MIIKPEKVVFETSHDIVDYISKGLPPTRKNFNLVMNEMNSVELADSSKPKAAGVEVIIPDSVKQAVDIDTFNQVCHRVYMNRVRTRNLVMVLAVTATLGTFIGIRSHKKKCECENDD